MKFFINMTVNRYSKQFYNKETNKTKYSSKQMFLVQNLLQNISMKQICANTYTERLAVEIAWQNVTHSHETSANSFWGILRYIYTVLKTADSAD